MIKTYKFSILVALVILYLSLANAHTFDKVAVFNIPYIDKIVHFGMYFGLMFMIIIENRKSTRSVKDLFTLSLIPLSYGIIIEILQSVLTVTRSGSFFDVIADLTGILVSIMIFIIIKPLNKEIFKQI